MSGELGVDWCMEIATERARNFAWKDGAAVYLSFDGDVFEAGYALEGATLERVGVTPREALGAGTIGRADPVGMDLAEIWPLRDIAGVIVLMDQHASLVENEQLRTGIPPAARVGRQPAGAERDRAAEQHWRGSPS